MSSDFKPESTLLAFGFHYFNETLPPALDRKQNAKRRWTVRTVCRLYRGHLQREPQISDLDREAVVSFIQDMDGKPNYARCRDTLRTLRKQAILAGLLKGSPGHALLSDKDLRTGTALRNGSAGVNRRTDADGKPVPKVRLSEEEGCLWWYCSKRYFPSNLAIRSIQTKQQYKASIAHLHRFLGRTPMPADLAEENVIGAMKMISEEPDARGRLRAPRSVNEMRNRLRALWEWLARKRIVEEFPTVGAMPVPKRIPKAWSREQLAALFDACRNMPGYIAGVSAAYWWESLHLVGWDSSERIGALLKARWSHLDLDRGTLSLPAEIRKGSAADASYMLHADTLALLAKMREPQRELIWHWPMSSCQYFLSYRELLRRAGLPYERGTGFHKMRKSVASHLHAGGHNATEALGHSAAHVTKASYLDPSISGTTSPAQLLFRPGEEKPALPVPKVIASATEDVEALAWM
jgi:integrase